MFGCNGHERKFERVVTMDTTGAIISDVLSAEDALREGPSKFYYPNGTLKDEISYHNGVKTGWHLHYREDGTLEYKVAYSAGEQHGPGYWYDKSGALELRGNWHHGKEFGRFIWYRPDGTIKAVDFHDFYGKVYCKADYPAPNTQPLYDGLVLSPGTWSSPRLDTVRVGTKTTVQVAVAQLDGMVTTCQAFWDGTELRPLSLDSIVLTLHLSPVDPGNHTLRIAGTMKDERGNILLQNTVVKEVVVLP